MVESAKPLARERLKANIFVNPDSPIYPVLKQIEEQYGAASAKQVLLAWACTGASLEQTALFEPPDKAPIPLLKPLLNGSQPVRITYKISTPEFLIAKIKGQWQKSGPRAVGLRLVGLAEQVLKLRSMATAYAAPPIPSVGEASKRTMVMPLRVKY